MMLPFSVFYRRFGLRLPQQMTKPALPRLEALNLPRDAIYHYQGTGPLDDGPLDTENALKNTTKPFQLEVISALSETKGNPRRLPIDVNRIARNFRMKNPKFRQMRSLESATRDPQSVLVYNYSYIHRLYRYMRNYYTAYHQQYNVLATVVKTMAGVAAQSDRFHFLETDMPVVIPSVSQLRNAEKNMDQRHALIFSKPETLVILELWKWLGPNRSSSVFSYIAPEQMRKINLIVRESERWTVVNLGQLADWRKATREELSIDPLGNRKGHAPEQLQKMMLRMCMVVSQARVQNVPENLGDEVLVSADADAPVEEIDVVKPIDDNDDEGVDHQILDADGQDEIPVVVDDAGDQLDTELDEDLQSLELVAEQVAVPADDQAFEPVIVEAKTLDGALVEFANNLAETGGLTAAEYKRYVEAAGNYKTITAPNGQTMEQFLQVTPEMTAIHESPSVPDRDTVLDKSMLKSSLLEFDKRYITEVMQRDIAGMVMNLQQAGIMVQEYNVEPYEDITSAYDKFTIRVKPLQGTSSTLMFRMPKVREDGTFLVNGTNYRTRKQKGHMPISKTSPIRVALTSYYGKLFAERSQKRVNDYGRWLRNAVMALALDNESDLITNMSAGNIFANDVKVPLLYSTLSQNFRSLTLKITEQNGTSMSWDLSFDVRNRLDLLDGNRQMLRTVEKGGNLLVGTCAAGAVMVMDKHGALYRISAGEGGNQTVALPAFEDILGIRSVKNPVDVSELRVFGKMVSIGVILGYLLGLDGVLKRLGVRPRIVPAGQRSPMAAEEWAVVFQDETWVFNRDDVLATMVLGGWRDHHAVTGQHLAHEFNHRDVYFNLLEGAGLGVRYLREFDLLNQMFIDPITKELLLGMGEPTTFPELLIRSCELLTSDYHLDETDSTEMRIKGYERFAGLMYTELVRSVRVHNARASKGSYPLELNPYAVWIAINDDPAKVQCDEINPIHNLKEIEAVTFSGTGGRSGRSMVKRTRGFHKSDLGKMSESTSDSSDVGINTHLSADPQFDSLRGTAKPYIPGETGAASLISTSSNLAVAADRDDVKRSNFTAIQNSHTLACEGYTQAMVRTGYEQIIPSRGSDLFAVIAKQAGEVFSRDDHGIVVTYADGSSQGVELGTRYGKAAGLVIPHTVVSPLTKGRKFEVGDVIAYNNGFYEPDVLNPKQVVLKFGKMIRVALMESADTLEDSSAISTKVSSYLNTQVTKVKTVIVNFNQAIHKLVKVGDAVEYESILCMIEDAVSASNHLLDDDTLDTLRAVSAQTPQAKFKGVVQKVEVFYHGDTEDMSESLLALSQTSDVAIKRRFEAVGKETLSGSVDENFRIENDPLLLDTAAIQVTITNTVGAGVGDKGVFGSQMKSVFGRVYEEVQTESGLEVDAIFSAASMDNRIVTSPFVMGTTATLLKVIGQKMVREYKS